MTTHNPGPHRFHPVDDLLDDGHDLIALSFGDDDAFDDDDFDDDDDYSTALLDAIDPAAPLATDADLLERVSHLVQTAYRQRWWLFLLDADGVQAPVLPQLEMPRRFGEADADRLAEMLAGIGVEVPGIVLVWELPYAADSHPGPSMVQAAMARQGAALRAQIVVGHAGSVRLWEPSGLRGVA